MVVVLSLGFLADAADEALDRLAALDAGPVRSPAPLILAGHAACFASTWSNRQTAALASLAVS
jgi:hypothetical protein